MSALERELDHQLDRVHAARRGRLGHGRVRRHRRVEHTHAFVLRRARLTAERRAIGALVRDLHQPGDDLGVAEASLLLVDRVRTKLTPLRQPVEWQLGAERRERSDPTRMA